MRNLIYFISVTQDGFIVGPNGEFDFFVMNESFMEFLRDGYPETIPTHLHEAVGITGENKVFDTVLMGRGTYEVGLPHGIVSPYQQLKQYVFSSTLGELPTDDVELVKGDAVARVRQLKEENGMHIWLCGGGKLAGVLYDEIDTLIIKRHPVVIGAGLPLVVGEYSPRTFELTERYDVEGGVTISTFDANR